MGPQKLIKNVPKALLKPSHRSRPQSQIRAAHGANLGDLLANPSFKATLRNPIISGFQRLHFCNIPVSPTGVSENADDEPNPDADVSSATTHKAQAVCKLVLEAAGNSSHLESSLDSANVVEFLSPDLALQVLKRLNNAGIFTLRFFRWAQKRKDLHPIPDCYNALVESLGKIKQFHTAWCLVEEMRSKNILGKDTFALICRRYARAKKINEAIAVFRKMESKYGLKPTTQDYNRLLDTLTKSGHVERAQELFDKWKNSKFMPDIKSHTILLEGWGRGHDFLQLDEVRRQMMEDGFEQDVVSYGILITAHCRLKKLDEAIRLYQEMEQRNIKPTPHIFCTLINAFGHERRLAEAVKYFQLCKESNHCIIEAPTYNSMVGAYCWSEKFDDAYRVVDEMRRCGVGPNARTHDIILHHLVRLGRTKEAYWFFKGTCGGPGCEQASSTYEIMVRMLCDEGRVEMALGVWGEMKARGVAPRIHMFGALIEGLCGGNRVDEACRCFLEMVDMGIRPPNRVFGEMKRCLVKEGREDVVLILARRIEILGGLR